MRKIVAFLALMLLVSLPKHVVSADCSPYELYSVDSVFKLDGWLLIRVSHWSYTCEMIAGEWENRVADFDSYLTLTDGREAFLIGGSGSLPDWTTSAGFLNGTLYAIRISRSRESYKNVTLTINNKPKNFTLTRNVKVKEVYRFTGDCFEPVLRCVLIQYPNGTTTKTCNGIPINVSLFKPPVGSIPGSPATLNGRNLIFSFNGQKYTFRLPMNMNASQLSLTVLEARNGIVLVNNHVVRLPAGVTIENVPVLFKIENRTIVPIRIQTDFRGVVCNNSGSESGGSNTQSKASPRICGPGIFLMAAGIPSLLRRAKQ
ncbi:hypothetical protein [Thermococcus sp.]